MWQKYCMLVHTIDLSLMNITDIQIPTSSTRNNFSSSNRIFLQVGPGLLREFYYTWWSPSSFCCCLCATGQRQKDSCNARQAGAGRAATRLARASLLFPPSLFLSSFARSSARSPRFWRRPGSSPTRWVPLSFPPHPPGCLTSASPAPSGKYWVQQVLHIEKTVKVVFVCLPRFLGTRAGGCRLGQLYFCVVPAANIGNGTRGYWTLASMAADGPLVGQMRATFFKWSDVDETNSGISLVISSAMFCPAAAAAASCCGRRRPNRPGWAIVLGGGRMDIWTSVLCGTLSSKVS